jgi:hypothetical protein
MAEQVMADPAPENIEGQKVVTHRFDHGIDWEVNVSHLLIAVAVLAFVFYLHRRRAGSTADEQDGALG